MDYYFTNKKVKKTEYVVNLLQQEDYTYFVIEITVILSKLNKKINDFLNEAEWNTVSSEINKIEKLQSIFTKTHKNVTTQYVSCEINSPETEDSYYFFTF